MSALDLDIVVVTYNSESVLDQLVKCVSSIEPRSLTLVDNCSSDETVAIAKKADWKCEAKVIASPTNLGFGAGNNLGVRSSSNANPSEFLLLLNPDASISRNGVSTLLQALTADSSLACVGANLRDRAQRPVSSARALPSVSSIARRSVTDVKSTNGLVPAGWICGALMMWRREAFEQLAGFDERFFLYYEDTDICARAWRSGFSVAIDLGVDALHDQGHGRPTSSFLRWHSKQSRRIYAREWLGRIGYLSARFAETIEWLVDRVRGSR